MSEFELYGTCDQCGGEHHRLYKYKNRDLCKFCMVEQKDTTPEKKRQIEDPIDKFNELIRRTQI